MHVHVHTKLHCPTPDEHQVLTCTLCIHHLTVFDKYTKMKTTETSTCTCTHDKFFLVPEQKRYAGGDKELTKGGLTSKALQTIHESRIQRKTAMHMT